MSSSRSNTSPVTNQTDNRRVIGENGISAENSSVSVVNNTLDPNVVAAALQFAGNGQTSSFNFGSEALANALGFGGSALTAALNASSDALAFADSNASRNSAMAYNVFSDALGTSENALSRAFTFGANALDRSFNNLGDTQQLVADAYADAKGRGALTDKILIGAIAAMAVVAFAAVKK